MAEYNPFSLKGKYILVTGASSGIGRSVAVTCSKMGAIVIANGRNSSKLTETVSLLEGDGHIVVQGDLTDSIKSIVSNLPELDGVVHCAGMGQRIISKLLTMKDVSEVMNINFKAPVLLQSELLQQKKIKKCASIVFIASIAAWTPSFGNSMYSASKGAIISYAKCLSLELAPRLIRVNCISPAMIWTDLIFKDGISEEQLREDEKKYPLKRYGQPEDVANLTVYLLSDASTWMTGNNIQITGGVN